MISRAYITEWREKVFWQMDSQVEQDLILSRLLVEIFSSKLLSEKLLFRGGTAIYKLTEGYKIVAGELVKLL